MKDTVRFTDLLCIRCPASLSAAIETAAARNLMTASEYVRRSVIDRLKADGIDPLQASLQESPEPSDIGSKTEPPVLSEIRTPRDRTKRERTKPCLRN